MNQLRGGLFLALTATLALACGDDSLAPVAAGGGGAAATTSGPSPSATTGGEAGGADGGGGAGGDDPCPLLTPDNAAVFFESFAPYGVVAAVDRPLDDAYRTRLTVELYADDGSGALPPLETGVFDLSQAPDDSYGTCQHCVLLVGYDASKQPIRAFSPTEGTMIVTHLGDEGFLSSVTGRLEGVRLAEVTQNEDLSWELIPGGACVRIADWSFDTVPGSVASCDSAEACGHEAYEVCDPATGMCTEGQCSLTFDPPFCGDGELCLSQLGALDGSDGGPAIGACYAECDPARDDCGDGRTCVPLGPTQAIGVCMSTGQAGVGQPCELADITTGCEEGSICRDEPGRCAPICPYLTEESGCPDETFCALDNSCRPAAAGDDAAIGEACDDASPILFDCGIEGDAFRGICMNFFPEDVGTTCERLCRIDDPACPGEQECLGLFSNPAIGVCRDPAVCGDGVLDVIGGEVCDDADTEGGDGCSADCREVELGPLCASAEELPLGVPIEGTNAGGATGYLSACDPYVVNPTARWAFTAPAAGKLTLRLSSDADLGLSVLGDCLDAASELGCSQEFLQDDVLDVNFLAPSPSPALVLVRGGNPSEAGPFTLEAEFVVAVCGDGLVGGAEVCDDGDTEGDDACAADCSAIGWAAVCAGLPELTLDAPIEGDTTDGTAYFDLAGHCSWAGGGGRERAYRFVAPSSGTLSLALQQPDDADLTLYVRDGCGPIDDETYLACSNSGFPGEIESDVVEVTEGQLVTVIVDGFRPHEAGAFTLTAQLTP
jgi:cysteine-rich repeat protein